MAGAFEFLRFSANAVHVHVNLVSYLLVLRPRTSFGVQSLHALASAESIGFRDGIRYAFATVPEDVGSGDIFGFADWAVHALRSLMLCTAVPQLRT